MALTVRLHEPGTGMVVKRLGPELQVPNTRARELASMAVVTCALRLARSAIRSGGCYSFRFILLVLQRRPLLLQARCVLFRMRWQAVLLTT